MKLLKSVLVVATVLGLSACNDVTANEETIRFSCDENKIMIMSDDVLIVTTTNNIGVVTEKENKKVTAYIEEGVKHNTVNNGIYEGVETASDIVIYNDEMLHANILLSDGVRIDYDGQPTNETLNHRVVKSCKIIK